jgi:broad specificity phosphatase PhoE
MTRLLLARHGETDWNREGRFQGQIDIPLNATGCAQAQAVAERLADHAFDAIYASDLQRTYETATIIAGERFLVYAEPRLREMGYGVFQGLTFAEMVAQYPEVYTAWQPARLQIPPGGESLAEFAARVRAFIDDVVAGYPNQSVLVVSHGEVLQLLVCLVLGLPVAQYWRVDLVDNGALLELDLAESDQSSLLMNAMQYLQGTSHDG